MKKLYSRTKYLTQSTRTMTSETVNNNGNLLIQCILFTVPVEVVLRFSPQEMQDSRPFEGW